ncbi:hypothetical protein Kisp01_70230 [Kineosporia sp. NBRC 101677]|uniref:hypothetical protein n=1 Tax=Kineosporia sp. NBRC 101677 TaxID=3032197 RepID=UPI0024A30315|nr:hypothetical protein [Kineosporia sp. NBRC 101677]GLY20009.1 hypothetical protein Kisp01_70230 [Kineosporia sp. NBRC 101677]
MDIEVLTNRGEVKALTLIRLGDEVRALYQGHPLVDISAAALTRHLVRRTHWRRGRRRRWGRLEFRVVRTGKVTVLIAGDVGTNTLTLAELQKLSSLLQVERARPEDRLDAVF